jgi:hypothetical protein
MTHAQTWIMQMSTVGLREPIDIKRRRFMVGGVIH